MKKEDFATDHYLCDFLKMGTLVVFCDNSYTTDVNGNKALPTFENGCGVYKIIDCNKAFPTEFSEDFCSPINSIKVIGIDTGNVFHCSKINIVSINRGYIGDEQSVKYKGEERRCSEVFINPYPFI